MQSHHMYTQQHITCLISSSCCWQSFFHIVSINHQAVCVHARAAGNSGPHQTYRERQQMHHNNTRWSPTTAAHLPRVLELFNIPLQQLCKSKLPMPYKHTQTDTRHVQGTTDKSERSVRCRSVSADCTSQSLAQAFPKILNTKGIWSAHPISESVSDM